MFAFLASLQVVMPTVEADVAFGLGARKRPLDEAAVRRRVLSSLDAVGMLEYARVRTEQYCAKLF